LHPEDVTNRVIRTRRRLPPLIAVVAVAVTIPLAGCGGGGGGSAPSTAASTPQTAPNPAGVPSCGSSTPSTAASEAASTAQGDIPDNQQFLSFANPSGGYSISYPEGWARSGNGNDVLFQDKSNTITIKVAAGSPPTPASVTAELGKEASRDPCLTPGKPESTTAGANKVVKVTYTTEGQKSPVTGKRPKISVDRYVYFKGGKVATVDLATPVGVDNVDAYRMISESFRWS
jgi:hypothetical protein